MFFEHDLILFYFIDNIYWQYIYSQERPLFLKPLKKRPAVLHVVDIVNAVSIDTMYLLFESANQILDMEL